MSRRGVVGEGGERSLAVRLARRIASVGPIPVSEYVQACLYDNESGFFIRGGQAGGRAGDFLTAPEVGPLFGAVLARTLDAWWADLGSPEPFIVIEWGAGPGTLARAVLAAQPRCVSAGALRWVALEISLSQRVRHPRHPLVTSAALVSEALPDGAAAGVVLANEFLDNLPFDIVQRTGDGWNELRVGFSAAGVDGSEAGADVLGVSGADVLCTRSAFAHDTRKPDQHPAGAGGFALVPVNASAELVAGLPDVAADVAAGMCLPVQGAARRWVSEAHNVLREGWIAAFDYGADTAELALRAGPAAATDGRQAAVVPHVGVREVAAPCSNSLSEGLGWLRAHRSHDRVFSWLRDPGSCDITTDVAIDQVQADYPAEMCTQAEFLRAHGIGDLVDEGRAVWSERAGVGDLGALRARSRVSEAEALLDPAGMGGFKVLIWPVGDRSE